MRLPDGFTWAFPPVDTSQWCIRQDGADRLLCGQFVGFAAEVTQPADPQLVHDRCVTALDAYLNPPVALGMCPVCWLDVPVVAGRIVAHNGCVGVNMLPRRRHR